VNPAILLALALLAEPGAVDPHCGEALGFDPVAIGSFEAAVRAALRAPGSARFGALVGFPLRVNSKDPGYGQIRTLWIRSAQEFARYGDAILSKGFRNSVLRAKPHDLICRTGEFGMAGGLIWVYGYLTGLRIAALNAGDFRWPDMAAAPLLACETADRRIVVDRPRTEVRFRSWAKKRPRGSKPDTLIEGGTEEFQGSGVCVHALWRFTDGELTYVVEQEGCSNGSNPRRVGWLSVGMVEPLEQQAECESP
jgi:hypothetical protein